MNGTVMGTIRAAQIGHGLTSTEQLFEKHGMPLARYAGRCWEIGRLVIDERFRAGPEQLRLCMSAAFRYFIAHEEAAHFFAVCVPALARLYRRFGFAVLVDDAQPETGTFALVHGSREDLLQRLGNDAFITSTP